MPVMDFWTWTKKEKEEICLEASKQADSCTSLISLAFAQLDKDVMKTVEQLLESVSETLSEALLTDYTEKHDVDLESVKQFNLDKMEA